MSTESAAPTPTETAAAPAPASFAELRTELVGADASFLVSCQERQLTLPVARREWMAEQSKRLETANQAAATATAKKGPGLDPVTIVTPANSTAATGDAVQEWDAAFAEAVQKCNGNKARALTQLAAERPELHQQYLAQYRAQLKK